jgi:hypothetical protein
MGKSLSRRQGIRKVVELRMIRAEERAAGRKNAAIRRDRDMAASQAIAGPTPAG